MTGIYAYMAGDAMTIVAGTDRSETALGSDRGNYIGPLGQYSQTAPATSRKGCGSATCVPWLDISRSHYRRLGRLGTSARAPSAGRADGIWAYWENFYPIKGREAMHFQLRGEFFNNFNHTQLQDPTVTVNSGNFGGIYAAYDPRIIQLAVKFFF